jgi:hypothetical protein
MCTGKPPWADQYPSHVSAMFQIATTDALPELPSHISPEGRHFIAACLQRDPKERPTAHRLLQHPWILGKTLEESNWKARGLISQDTQNLLNGTSQSSNPSNTSSTASLQSDSSDNSRDHHHPPVTLSAPSTAPIRSVHPAVTRIIHHEAEAPKTRLSPSNSHSNLANFVNFSQDLHSVSSSPVSRPARRINEKSKEDKRNGENSQINKEKPRVERSQEKTLRTEERNDKEADKGKETGKKDKTHLTLNLIPLEVGKKSSESLLVDSILDNHSGNPSPSHSSRDTRDSLNGRHFESSHNDSPAHRQQIAVRPFLPSEPSENELTRHYPHPHIQAPSTAPIVPVGKYSNFLSTPSSDVADAGMIQNFLVESMAEKLENLKQQNAQFYQHFKLKIVRATKPRKNSAHFVDPLDATIRPSSPSSVTGNSGFSSSTAEYYAAPIAPSLGSGAQHSYKNRFDLPSGGSDANANRHHLPIASKDIITRPINSSSLSSTVLSAFSQPSGRP